MKCDVLDCDNEATKTFKIHTILKEGASSVKRYCDEHSELVDYFPEFFQLLGVGTPLAALCLPGNGREVRLTGWSMKAFGDELIATFVGLAHGQSLSSGVVYAKFIFQESVGTELFIPLNELTFWEYTE